MAKLAVVVVVSLALLSGFACRPQGPPPSAADAETAPPPELRAPSEPMPLLPGQVTEMTVLSAAKQYTLSADFFMALPQDQEPIKVPVVLERITYRVRASVHGPDGDRNWVGDAWCYDLHSTHPAHPYSHTFWLRTHVEPPPEREGVVEWFPHSLQFFALPDGGKYLASSDPSCPWVLDVGKPLSKEDSLREYISRDVQVPRETVNITPLILAGAVLYVGSAPLRVVPYRRLFPVDAFMHSWHGSEKLEIRSVEPLLSACLS